MQYRYVNNFPVIAEMQDTGSLTAQSVVVCDRGDEYIDRYAVWTVRKWGDSIAASNGTYTPCHGRALVIAALRASA